jgi:hypothetical protein
MMSNQAHFAQVPSADIPRSTFDRSYQHKTTMDFGYLVPVHIDEVMPGDSIDMELSTFGRLATPIHPVMDNMYLETFAFFVPYRQVWSNFRKFMGEQVNPGDSIDYTVPKLSGTKASRPDVADLSSKLMDYMGIPYLIHADNVDINALPFRAYNHIVNEWFRDQNLQNSYSVPTGDGPDATVSHYKLLKRGKRHDYFTSCLPWPQKGDSVSLPFLADAPVTGIAINSNYSTYSTPTGVETGGATVNYFRGAETQTGDSVIVKAEDGSTDIPEIYANLTGSTLATINQLRQAFQIQRLQERDARGGTRYPEIVLSHFGVRFMDVTYRPEYLGGSSQRLNINVVPQTSSTDATTPQGNLSAYGTFGSTEGRINKSFTEHGVIIVIMSARADLTYQQGLDRMYSRRTRYDFYWPVLAHIGEQAVLNKEIYTQGTAADDDVFGYQERYGEYRYKPNRVSGLFRSNVSGTLDSWHLAQDFSSLPVLSDSFIQEQPPIDRVVALPSEPDLLVDIAVNLKHTRPMPVYGVPGMMDHF